MRILVTPKPFYIPEQSNPEDAQYAFGYEIHIHNESNSAVQLLERHWFITDANDQLTEVQGIGVVGEQPTLQPNGTYSYQSGTMLKTPFGCMRGTYTFLDKMTDLPFDVEIPAFSLAIPHLIN